MKDIKEFKLLFKLVKEEKNKLIFACILIFFGEIAGILGGYLNGAAVEAITNLKLKQSLIFIGLYFILEFLIFDLFLTYSYTLLNKIEFKISQKLELLAYKKALDLPAYAYEKTSSGEIINRVTNDTDTLSDSFGELIETISSLVGSFILIFYVFFNSWIVGIEILLAIIILYFVINKYNPTTKKLQKEIKEENDKVTSLVTESIRGVREIKTLGVKTNLISEVSKLIKDIFKKFDKERKTRQKVKIIVRGIKDILEISVFVTILILLYLGKTNLTFFVAMTYYIYRYTYLIERINNFIKLYQKVVVSITRVNDILENRLYEDEYFGTEKLDKVNGIIEFKNINFSYPDEDVILRNFNLTLKPNKKIAIVGKSGQGKSTLFNLITRVFDPTSGEILLDGINIKDLSEKELRKHISIIRQEPFIFNRTIKENFKVVDKNIDLDTIRKYTKIAYLDDYIMSLPEKYETCLGEGGVNLSGGQKQRLAIARTLIKQSKVILFDEATSALDNNSQEYIKKAIDNLVKDHTVVIVAHRLSTIIDADVIYVVDGGKIVAQGKHEELLKTSKIYKNLYITESFN